MANISSCGIIIGGGICTPIYAGPNPSPLWLSGPSSGYIDNPGMTPTNPSPAPGTAPSGVGTGGAAGLAGIPDGSGGCSGGGCGS